MNTDRSFRVFDSQSLNINNKGDEEMGGDIGDAPAGHVPVSIHPPHLLHPLIPLDIDSLVAALATLGVSVVQLPCSGSSRSTGGMIAEEGFVVK
jgi:hypothetical protein